ncbi:hypothetical protein FHX10_003241 [Rhizobium sp. BK591]|uniref:hypothetical protein n=1 Tax=Rhizobium sp. BK591 TaxID=2586985 RepID=UPI0016093C06|nr:hypothetical protein [Rhizobium sp. BK591]MBB3743742.1 hypothetical protein [Rhizobium sp. BK591]
MVAHYPPAFCVKHGIFQARGFALEDDAYFSMVGCETDCPTCGARSEVLPGFYQATKDRLDILIDAAVSPDALRALQDVAIRLQRNEISTAQASLEAEKISPKFSRIFRGLKQESVAMIAAAVISAAAAVYVAKVSSSGNVTINNYNVPVISEIHLPAIGPFPAQRPTSKSRLKSSSSIPSPKR